MPTNSRENAYEIARQCYEEHGVDTDAALERLARIAVSMHCWQGDDVGGFETDEGLTGVGEARALNRTDTVLGYLKEITPRYVLGHDPFDIERLIQNTSTALTMPMLRNLRPASRT